MGPDRKVSGWYDDNPMLNAMVYHLEFPDDTIKEYSVNIIAENMLTQLDSDGFTMTTMEGVIDHEKDGSTKISKDNKYISCS